MKNNRNNYNQIEYDLLQQKLDKAYNQINEFKIGKSNDKFIIDTIGKERDRATLACKYLTHLFLVMDSLDRILKNDCSLGWVVSNAIYEFKKKINDGMLDIKYDGQDLWYDGNYDDEIDKEDD